MDEVAKSAAIATNLNIEFIATLYTPNMSQNTEMVNKCCWKTSLKFTNFGETHSPEFRMKCVVVLTESEEATLQQLSINHPYQDMRTRAAALLILAGSKLRPMAVGAKLGVSGQSIHNWARRGSSQRNTLIAESLCQRDSVSFRRNPETALFEPRRCRGGSV
ncbi:hypothetical protein [Burkholderia ubonensis]|uniref:hypothetical protein n=1 Tax=Burkholderia ubonensis TaxID=101571 RepID=UPI001E630C3E|nr:hypothetical protein [Burkholderia ubonensis]